MMLLAQTLMRLLRLYDDGSLCIGAEYLIQVRLHVVLIQILNQTLMSQNTDGTWDSNPSPEICAYAILTLVALQCLPQADLLESKTRSAIESGRQALLKSENEWTTPEYIWIEKVTYGSSALSEAYCMAAMNAPCRMLPWNEETKDLIAIPLKQAMMLRVFFNNLPEYLGQPGWKILASVIEGFAYLPQLKAARLEIFPRQKSANDKYLTYVPITWTLVNNCKGHFLDGALLWDMIVVSMLDYLVDEYLESVVAILSERDLASVEQIVKCCCKSPDVKRGVKRSLDHMNGDNGVSMNGNGEFKIAAVSDNGVSEDLVSIEKILASYVRAMLDHPQIQRATASDQAVLRIDLQTTLLSHIEHFRDNKRFSSQEPHHEHVATLFHTPRTSHYEWCHTTAAHSTASAPSFSFYICLLSDSSMQNSGVFRSSYQNYLAKDLTNHLGVMTRLYNDYGSIPRDRAERNLNSVNFRDLHTEPVTGGSDHVASQDAKAKKTLLQIAEYERKHVQMATKTLLEALDEGPESRERVTSALKLFVDVVYLYGDMYVARDLTNRVER